MKKMLLILLLLGSLMTFATEPIRVLKIEQVETLKVSIATNAALIVEIHDPSGHLIHNELLVDSKKIFNLKDLEDGEYTFQIKDGKRNVIEIRKITIKTETKRSVSFQ